MIAARDVDERVTRAEVLAPLVRLLFNVRAVTLLLVSVTATPDGWRAVGVVALMAATSVGPLLRWRRIGPWVLRHPSAVGLDLIVLLLVLMTAGVDTPFTVYALSTAVLLGILYGRWGGLTLASLVLCGYLVAVAAERGELAFASTALVPLLLPASALLGAELRRLLEERDRALRDARLNLVRAATAEERARLAREMHDSVAKTLHGLALQAASVGLLAERDPQKALAEVTKIQHAAQVASREARALLQDLRIDDLSQPFATAVRRESEAFGCQHGLRVTVRLDGDTEPEPAVRHEALQVLREALHNVAKHAQATSVRVASRIADGTLHLEVEDDGVGMELPDDPAWLMRQGHHGIVGLHERAAQVGGRLEVRSEAGAGTRVSLAVPCELRSRVPA